MVQPVATVTLGGTDISNYVAAPEGGTSLIYGRGANFDGSVEAPGYCQVSVKNNDRRFDPYNAGSSLASVLKIGKKIRVSTLHNSITYYEVEAYLTRIVSDPETGFATLYAEDALGRYGRREVSLEASVDRDLQGFRTAILDYLGVAAGDRNLGTGSTESATPLTGGDQESALELLSAINRATGSIHFMNPDAAGSDYSVMSRLVLQAAPSIETFSDTDFTQPFVTSLSGFDYTAEGVINQMRVGASPRLLSETESVIWELPESVTAAAGVTVDVWAEWSDPAFTMREEYDVEGTGTVTVTYFRKSAKISFVGGAGPGTLLVLTLYGYSAPVVNLETVEENDTTSQTAYDIQRESIDSEYILSEAEARGLAKWYIYRYKDPQPRPRIVVENRFPYQFVVDVGHRVTVTSAELSLSAVPFLVRSIETRVRAHGALWETEIQLEGAPPLLSLFTIGGTAAQGVGGTGVLGV